MSFDPATPAPVLSEEDEDAHLHEVDAVDRDALVDYVADVTGMSEDVAPMFVDWFLDTVPDRLVFPDENPGTWGGLVAAGLEDWSGPPAQVAPAYVLTVLDESAPTGPEVFPADRPAAHGVLFGRSVLADADLDETVTRFLADHADEAAGHVVRVAAADEAPDPRDGDDVLARVQVVPRWTTWP